MSDEHDACARCHQRTPPGVYHLEVEGERDCVAVEVTLERARLAPSGYRSSSRVIGLSRRARA